MFIIRLMFNGVSTATIFTYDTEEDRDVQYDRFLQLKSDREVFYGPVYCIDMTSVRMIEKM